MSERSNTDFTGVISGLIFNNPKIEEAPATLTNHKGVYCNPEQDLDYRYAVAFMTTYENGQVWVETYGIKLQDSTLLLNGRWGSKKIGFYPAEDDLIVEASVMIDDCLT